ncbi:hypothetical protein [Solicola sp. PLA-1-18]|uniref:hypothetical protein n=1 Tax=Solicola sp. PLA-1-18 TaxID=3380532 RepID=UPI003B800FF5
MAPDPDGRALTPVRLTIAAVVLIAIVALVTFLVVRSTDSDTDAASEPATPTASSAPPGPSDSAPSAGETYDSACGLRGGSLQEPTQQPDDLTFERVDGWAYPISKSAGPGRRDPQGAWSCFARTPTGAVVAAQVIGLRVGLASDFSAVVRAQTVPGVGQNQLLQAGQPEGQGITDTKGFVLESYSNDEAVVSYYLVQQGRSFTCSQEVQWRDDDWKLRLGSDGSTSSGCVESAPSRYVPWGSS